jgi:DNA modification methylase
MQIVLDFTMGSNKSGLACEILNRKFIGIEKDAEHFATSINRISVWVLNTKLHINDK